MFFVSLLPIIAIGIKIAIAVWIYKDAKLNGENGFLWAVLAILISAPLALIIYAILVRENKRQVCWNCGYRQSIKENYCGNCGEKLFDKDDRYVYEGKESYKKPIIMVISLFVIIIFSLIFLNTFVFHSFPDLPVSIMQTSKKYGNTWQSNFKYKNGRQAHYFKIKDKKYLNYDYKIDDGNIEFNLYNEDKLIKKLGDKKEDSGSIDLSSYRNIKLEILCNKASGRFKFNLSN
ncbi:MAG: hypothetical protein ACTHWZ_07485 [Peptoniphilaceae bacterium]